MFLSIVKPLSFWYLGKRAISRLSGPKGKISDIKSSFYKNIWQEAAKQTGALFTDVGFGIYEIQYKEKLTRVYENYTELENIMAMKVAGNKPLVLSLLAKNNVSIPKYKVYQIDNLMPAVKFIHNLDLGCVVKPAIDTAAGSGVSTNIFTKAGLVWSAARAGAFGQNIIVEEFVQGNNYRLLYLDGQFLDAVLRKPPSVRGDGKTSIKDLVRNENSLRIKKGWDRAQALIGLDGEMKNCLQKQGLSLKSILPDGETIPLKTVINQNNSYENERVTDICQSIINDGAKAVKLIGAKIAGVDIITNDPTIPLQESRGVVIEVNTTPGYYCHYKNTKEPFLVANRVLETIFRSK